VRQRPHRPGVADGLQLGAWLVSAGRIFERHLSIVIYREIAVKRFLSKAGAGPVFAGATLQFVPPGTNFGTPGDTYIGTSANLTFP